MIAPEIEHYSKAYELVANAGVTVSPRTFEALAWGVLFDDYLFPLKAEPKENLND